MVDSYEDRIFAHRPDSPEAYAACREVAAEMLAEIRGARMLTFTGVLSLMAPLASLIEVSSTIARTQPTAAETLLEEVSDIATALAEYS